MPLEKKLVIENQKFEFIRLLYGIPIRPVTFFDSLSKIFTPKNIGSNVNKFLGDIFKQSHSNHEMFQVKDK